MFFQITTGIIGMLMLVFSLICNANPNVFSKIVFKIFPFFSGCILVIRMAFDLNWFPIR